MLPQVLVGLPSMQPTHSNGGSAEHENGDQPASNHGSFHTRALSFSELQR
jgi:hypothetical protein